MCITVSKILVKALIVNYLEERYAEERYFRILLKTSVTEKETKEEESGFSIRIFMTKDLSTNVLLLGWILLG